MTTYANIKLSEIFALYGNPFTRGSCMKNFKEKIIKKQYNKVNFEKEKEEESKKEAKPEENSQINLLNKNENNLLSLNQNKSIIKFGSLSNNKINSQINLNTDAFSENTQKKRNQIELIKKTIRNFSSEEYADNTKISSVFQNKKKIIDNINSEKI